VRRFALPHAADSDSAAATATTGQVSRTFKKAPREAEQHEHLTFSLDE
jgi:hypothetical protein